LHVTALLKFPSSLRVMFKKDLQDRAQGARLVLRQIPQRELCAGVFNLWQLAVQPKALPLMFRVLYFPRGLSLRAPGHDDPAFRRMATHRCD
jgi:hypothetical protein